MISVTITPSDPFPELVFPVLANLLLYWIRGPGSKSRVGVAQHVGWDTTELDLLKNRDTTELDTMTSAWSLWIFNGSESLGTERSYVSVTTRS